MKSLFLSLLLVLSIAVFSQAVKTSNMIKDPIVFIDGTKRDVKQMHKLSPSDIISVSVFKGEEAIAKAGPEAKDGVLYIETKPFVRNQYWKYFASKSPEYASAIKSVDDFNTTQYVLNGRIVTENIDKTLSGITDKNFRSLVLINQEDLLKEYRVKDKKYGVVILSDPRH
ncbi:MAG: hypothetical protein NVS3B19_19330 [Ginsengibacter sp.]